MAKDKPKEAVSDIELFAAIRAKHDWALSALYDRYASRLYGLALRILRDPTQAEDVLQDLMLYLWENAHKFDRRRGNAVAWLLVLCRNRCIDRLRVREQGQKRSASINEDTLQKFSKDESKTPLQIVDQVDMERHMQQALQKLPPEQRELIEMAYFEGLSQSEIAGKLDLPLGTVKTRIRLGMLKLRDLMKPTTV